MMMPAVWWSAGVLPGRQVKSGSSASATFMRNVPEPQRQWLMRSRNSAGSVPAGEQLQVQQLGVEVGDHRRGAERLARLGHDPDGAPALDDAPRAPASPRGSARRARRATLAMAWVIAPMPPMA